MNTITWTVTPQQADIIMNALMLRPFTEVNNLINELLRQAKPPTTEPSSPQPAAGSVTQ